MKHVSETLVVLLLLLLTPLAMAQDTSSSSSSDIWKFVVAQLVLIIVCGVGFVLNKIRNKTENLEQKQRESEIKTNEKISDTVASIRKEIFDLGTSLRKEISDLGTSLRKEISDLGTSLRKEDASIRKDISDLKAIGFVQSESPLAITEKGKAIADEINIDQTIEKYWEIIKKSIDDANVNTHYDIQEKSANIADLGLNDILADTEIKIIKGIAYKNGVDCKKIFEIFAIKIRDKVLKERGL